MGVYNDLINERLMNETLYSTEPFCTLNTLTGEIEPLPQPKLKVLTEEELELCKRELIMELESQGFFIKPDGNGVLYIHRGYFNILLNTDGIFPYTSVLIYQINKAYERHMYNRGEILHKDNYGDLYWVTNVQFNDDGNMADMVEVNYESRS